MCSINSLLSQNQIDKIPQIQRDYTDRKRKVDKENQYTSIFEIIPTFRRIERVPAKIQDSDIVPAVGLVSLAILNGPEDLRDMESAYQQIKARFSNKSFAKPYDYKTAQHPFSFFRGTLLHKFVNPSTSPCPKTAKWLLKNDTTLMQTKLGDLVIKIFNIEETPVDTKIKNITYTKENPKFVTAKHFKANFLGELTARALTRTTKIGALIFAILESAHLVKEVLEGKNIFQSTTKSVINCGSSLAGIGYGGAIGAKYLGATGSIVGMGIGAIAGSRISELIKASLNI